MRLSGIRLIRGKYNFSHTVPQILAEYSGQTTEELESPRVTVRVAGRIMAIRLMGKAGFAHLQQDGQRLQIYVKKDAVGDAGFELWKLLDLGDHIGVRGYLFRTRTGELSIHAEELTFLVERPAAFAGKISRAAQTWNCATGSAIWIW